MGENPYWHNALKNILQGEKIMFKTKKIAAAIAAVIMTVCTMSISVSAAANDISFWSIVPTSSASSKYDGGTVTGLVQGKDTGVEFRCDGYINPTSNDFYAIGTVSNSILCLYQGDCVNLSYNGDGGTVLFQKDWYRYCNGSVSYRVDARNPVENSGQRIQGTAR